MPGIKGTGGEKPAMYVDASRERARRGKGTRDFRERIAVPYELRGKGGTRMAVGRNQRPLDGPSSAQRSQIDVR